MLQPCPIQSRNRLDIQADVHQNLRPTLGHAVRSRLSDFKELPDDKAHVSNDVNHSGILLCIRSTQVIPTIKCYCPTADPLWRRGAQLCWQAAARDSRDHFTLY